MKPDETDETDEIVEPDENIVLDEKGERQPSLHDRMGSIRRRRTGCSIRIRHTCRSSLLLLGEQRHRGGRPRRRRSRGFKRPQARLAGRRRHNERHLWCSNRLRPRARLRVLRPHAVRRGAALSVSIPQQSLAVSTRGKGVCGFVHVAGWGHGGGVLPGDTEGVRQDCYRRSSRGRVSLPGTPYNMSRVGRVRLFQFFVFLYGCSSSILLFFVLFSVLTHRRLTIIFVREEYASPCCTKEMKGAESRRARISERFL